jgi:hypothetical protein
LAEERGQSNSRQNTDDDDNNQQFNQGETLILSSFVDVLQELGFKFGLHKSFSVRGGMLVSNSYM